MRDAVLMSLVDRAMNDGEFRVRAKNDLQGTLKAYNSDLTADEMAAVTAFQSQIAGLTDGEFEQMFVATAAPMGPMGPMGPITA